MPFRLHVFQHVAHEGLGSLESVFVSQGARIAYTRLFVDEPLPDVTEFEMLVVLGGPMNVYEFEKYPWLEKETAAIRSALEAGKAVLGLCLGAQLMSVALGGRVTRNEHKEIGWWEVEKLRGVEEDPRAACFPARFTTFHWHGDTFSIPPDATALFRSEGCAHQGFAWGERAVGLQFHPEITAEAIDAWIAESVAEGGGDLKSGPYAQSAEAMRGDVTRVADNNRWMEKLCGLLMQKTDAENVRPMAGPILFFDGECVLCNGFADFVLRQDRRRVLRLATLQGATAASLLPDDVQFRHENKPVGYSGKSSDFKSIVLWDDGVIRRKSDAVLWALSRFGGGWRVMAWILRVVPRILRDGVYDVIARNRFRWFGRRETCRVPTVEERERFTS